MKIVGCQGECKYPNGICVYEEKNVYKNNQLIVKDLLIDEQFYPPHIFPIPPHE